MQKHKFPYNWRLSEAKFTKDKGKVFSCFACGGGSTMGYKLAGFDVIGCNEIDAKVNRCYVANHSPRYNFLEDIRTLRERERELPPDLYNLDILDGSPPCPCKYGFEQIVVGCKFQNGTVRQVKVDVRFQADRSREKLAVGNEYGSSSL